MGREWRYIHWGVAERRDAWLRVLTTKHGRYEGQWKCGVKDGNGLDLPGKTTYTGSFHGGNINNTFRVIRSKDGMPLK